MEKTSDKPLYRLQQIAATLRAPDGCPWDIKQTPSTLKPYAIEEAYELYDAIEKNDTKNIKEELGDLLYQVYAHSQIFSEQGEFTIDDVAQGIIDKLIRRHPHVFGTDTVSSSEEVSERWEKIKRAEKIKGESVMDGVPKAMPALLKAFRVQEKAARLGFDWKEITDIEKKLDEEIVEFKEALITQEIDSDHVVEELGDILFSIVNICRFQKINPEEALLKSTDKFISRFKFMEDKATLRETRLEKMSIAQLEELWQEAKTVEKNRKA